MRRGWYPEPRPPRPAPQRGIKVASFGASWWAQRWIEALEGVSSAYPARLARGRGYVRAGRVHDLVVEGSSITAEVIGSAAYAVRIDLSPLGSGTARSRRWARTRCSRRRCSPERCPSRSTMPLFPGRESDLPRPVAARPQRGGRARPVPPLRASRTEEGEPPAADPPARPAPSATPSSPGPSRSGTPRPSAPRFASASAPRPAPASALAPRPAGAIRANRDGIDAAVVFGLSNARLESSNTKLKLLTRLAFGFHSHAPLIALAMLKMGGLCPPLPRAT